MPRAFLAALIAASLPSISVAQSWPQWGRSPQHDSSSAVVGRSLDRISEAAILDPFTATEETKDDGDLLAHYAVPLIDGNNVFLVVKSGSFVDPRIRETQTWNVVAMTNVNGLLTAQWMYASDWKPVPWGSPFWEPVYHPAVTADAVWAPGAGGTVDRVSRTDGTRLARVNPFGVAVDPTIFVAGPLTVDDTGNVYYNAIQLVTGSPWTSDPMGSWLVRVGADGTFTKATFASLTPNAPDANAQCTTNFDTSLLPWPPNPTATAPTTRCGAQRPGINVAPALAPDGTIYTISRAHLNERWGSLLAVNPDLTLKWSASLRNRFHDGCNVALPPNGSPGGCRAGANLGVDPAENQAGSGRVDDDASSSPVVAPDGRILYGSYTRYNYSQGHLMMFGADGSFITAYNWGWDLTPAIYAHDGTYSILIKENHYSTGSYCNDLTLCPSDRTSTTPQDPESYYLTQLDTSLHPEWKYQNKNTQSCQRQSNGTLQCFSDHPAGFEWCVNAIAVDRRGVAYASSEDGNLYAIGQGGIPAGHIFLNLALGAAYTPTSIGPDGRIYTQNDGVLFMIDENPKRRAVRLK